MLQLPCSCPVISRVLHVYSNHVCHCHFFPPKWKSGRYIKAHRRNLLKHELNSGMLGRYLQKSGRRCRLIASAEMLRYAQEILAFFSYERKKASTMGTDQTMAEESVSHSRVPLSTTAFTGLRGDATATVACYRRNEV